MKLDKRLKISPFNCFDSKQARRYIDKMGYFSNNLGDFSDLSKCKFGTLGSIHDDTEQPYYMKENVTVNGFFVPETLVEPTKHNKRPFGMQEFKDNLPKMMFSDDLIHFRDKATDAKFSVKFVGEILDGSDWFVCLGTREYSLKELFEDFEYLDKDGGWNTFGVDEKWN